MEMGHPFFLLNRHLYSSKEKEKIHPQQDKKLMIVQNVQQESPISPAQKNILIINRSISLQTRNADCDNYKINLPNSQFSISFIESRPSELELSLNPSEQDQRFRSESKRERPSKAKIAMDSAARRSTAGGGIFEGLYKVLMRRNSIYVTFVVVGAYFGERAVDYGVHKLWEMNNVGKRYEDIPVLGQRPAEE